MIRIILSITLLLSPGLAAAGDTPPAAGAPALEGRLLVVRGVSGGEAQLTDSKGERFLLQGKWRPELLRLDGHLVKVWGTPGKKHLMTPTVKVARYAILDTGGGAPRVGVLSTSGDALTLTPEDGGGPVRLSGSRSMLRKLRKRAGCKVWVVARWPKKGEAKAKGKAVRARVYGWLSCPAASAAPETKSSTGKPGDKPPASGKSK